MVDLHEQGVSPALQQSHCLVDYEVALGALLVYGLYQGVGICNYQQVASNLRILFNMYQIMLERSNLIPYLLNHVSLALPLILHPAY